MDSNFNNKVKVLVVDDHPMFAHGTVSLLSTEQWISALGTAGNGRECLQLVSETMPDIVLLDINLPDICGVDLVEKLRKIHPPVKIIMLTGLNPREYLADSLMKGVQGFLLKDCSGTEMSNAIKIVYEGGVHYSQNIGSFIKKQATMKVFSDEVSSSNSPNPCETLSSREIDIMELMVKGLQNKEIAAHLGITLRTVSFHVSNILAKLEVTSRIEAVLKWSKNMEN